MTEPIRIPLEGDISQWPKDPSKLTLLKEDLDNLTVPIPMTARFVYQPTSWRLAKRNGELILQAGSNWVQGGKVGVEWNDVPTVDLDALPND